MSPIARTTTPPTARIEPITAIATVLAKGMNLPAGRIMIDYERWQIPKDGLFLVVGYLGEGVQVAARSLFDPASDSEVQETLIQQDVQIDLMSIIPDNSARLRRWEVPMSLNSFYSRNYCAAYGIGLPPQIKPMADTSKLEPGGYLNRFTTRVPVFSVEGRALPAGYFDTFAVDLTIAQVGSSETTTRDIPLEEP